MTATDKVYCLCTIHSDKYGTTRRYLSKCEKPGHAEKAAKGLVERLTEPLEEEAKTLEEEAEEALLYGYFRTALDDIEKTIRSKNKDYARLDNPFSNFEESAKSAGIEPWQAFENLIGTKEARLRNLELSQIKPMNESLLDTYKDRAVFGVLAYAYQLKLRDL